MDTTTTRKASAWRYGGRLALVLGVVLATTQSRVPAQNPCCIVVEPADTNVTVMRSGSEFSLQTRTRPVFFPPDPWDYTISFSFGFATDELAGESEILDSITLFLANTNTGVSATLFTADAAGFTWLPFTPGLLPLLNDALSYEPGDLPAVQPMPAHRLAYRVTFAVPASLAVQWTDLSLLLFDYPNGLNSVAWLDSVVVIPPPGKLEVDPGSTPTFRSVGPPGGAFTPSSQTYMVTNAGGQTLTWQAIPLANWLTASPAVGALIPGTTTNLSVRINALARSFGPGLYSSHVTFTNASVVTNATTRAVQLAIAARPTLELARTGVPGQYRLRLTATPFMSYRLEASGNFTAWTSIHTNTTAADGTFTYIDAGPSPNRFYRASFVNP